MGQPMSCSCLHLLAPALTLNSTQLLLQLFLVTLKLAGCCSTPLNSSGSCSAEAFPLPTHLPKMAQQGQDWEEEPLLEMMGVEQHSASCSSSSCCCLCCTALGRWVGERVREALAGRLWPHCMGFQLQLLVQAIFYPLCLPTGVGERQLAETPSCLEQHHRSCHWRRGKQNSPAGPGLSQCE